MELLERVRRTIERECMLARGDAVVVGVSGGPDSLCLLHVLCRLRESYALTLHVAHLNHQLRGTEAETDAQFVARLAAEWGLPVTVESVDVAAFAHERRLALEEAARQARYAFLSCVARQVGAHKIAVAHHADDQVETVLMHWLRGAGLSGLRGMQPVTSLRGLRLGEEQDATAHSRDLLLIRPLLEVPRSEIEAYCATHGLQPRFDRSNLDTTYYRNRLRHELLPLLETYNPRIREVILRSASLAAADYACLREQTEAAWGRVVRAENQQAISFRLRPWRVLPLAMQRSTVREAIHHLRRSLRNIDWVHVDNALQVLREGGTGMAATLPSGLRAQLGYDEFMVADEGYEPPPPDLPLLRHGELALRIPGVTPLPESDWRITTRIVAPCDVEDETLRPATRWQAYLDYDLTGKELRLRTRRTGDRFWPLGLGDRPTTVNGFMTNAKVPRVWRDALPLLVSPTQMLWMPGWRIDERAKVTQDTRRVLVLTFEKMGRASRSAGQTEPAAQHEDSKAPRHPEE
jgi:tRNA(Ile)-lysidine synthase